MAAPLLSTTHERALEIIALRKRIVGPVVWSATPDGSEIFRCDFVLLDDEDKTIAGLKVELQYVRGIVAGESSMKMTLFSTEPPQSTKLRAYQLCVVGKHRVKHRENGVPWHGPHKHVGDRAAQVDLPLDCNEHEAWFRFFLAEANIEHTGGYRPPPPRPPQQGELGLEP
jgi:hypothetical protein